MSKRGKKKYALRHLKPKAFPQFIFQRYNEVLFLHWNYGGVTTSKITLLLYPVSVFPLLIKDQ